MCLHKVSEDFRMGLDWTYIPSRVVVIEFWHGLQLLDPESAINTHSITKFAYEYDYNYRKMTK